MFKLTALRQIGFVSFLLLTVWYLGCQSGSSNGVTTPDDAFILGILVEPPDEDDSLGTEGQGAPPVADAGESQVVFDNTLVMLDGSGSSDPDGDPLTLTWTQTAGPPVSWNEDSPGIISFVAPDVDEDTHLEFTLSVSDGTFSVDDTVSVEVMNALTPAEVGLPDVRFTVLLLDEADPDVPLDGPRPLNLICTAATIDGQPLPEGTFTWMFDGVPQTGPTDTHATRTHTFTAACTHTVALSLTVSGLTVGCLNTQSLSLQAQPTVWPSISGKVLDASGAGVSGATVSANAGGTTSVTSFDGSYDVHVPCGWSGILTPEKFGYDFEPSNGVGEDCPSDDVAQDSRCYLDVSVDLTEQDFEEPASPSGVGDEVFCGGEYCGTNTACETYLCDGDACPAAPIVPLCDDGLFCNGAESCNPDSGDCIAGPEPCGEGGLCDEVQDTCTAAQCSIDADCDDGAFCNGSETCVDGLCVDGSLPCPDDLCIEDDDTCAECAGDADCNDGNACTTDSCQQGACEQIPLDCPTGETCVDGVCTDAQMIYGTITLVDTLGARPPIGQIELEFVGNAGSESSTTFTDIYGAYSHAVSDGWSGTVKAGDDSRVFLLTPAAEWTFGTDEGDDAPPVSGPVQLDFTAWTAPIGIPGPDFGIKETHWMYQLGSGEDCTTNPEKCFDFGNGLEPYPDAANGPYTHYVDNSGSCNDSNNGGYGSPTEPRCTIPADLSPGSVAEVHGGPYEPASMWIGNGTQAQPVFFRGTAPDNKIEIFDTKHKVLGEYLIVENFDANQSRFKTEVASHHVAIRYNDIHDRLDKTGINIGGTDIVIFNNQIHHNVGDGKNGVTAGGDSERVWIIDNDIHHNGDDSIAFCHTCTLETSPRFVYIARNRMHSDRENAIDLKHATDVVISQNEMYGYRSAPPDEYWCFDDGSYCNIYGSGSDGSAVVFQYGTDTVWVIFNEIHDSNHGIRNEETEVTYIIGNELYDIAERAIALEKDGPYMYIARNTIYDADIAIDQFWREMFGLHIFDNIIVNMRGTYFIKIESDVVAGQSEMSNNLFWNDGASIMVQWDKSEPDYDFNNPADLALFPGGINNIAGDPLLVDPANADFHLQAGSPANDSGLVGSDILAIYESTFGVPIDVDFDNTPRGQGSGWDMGAHERP